MVFRKGNTYIYIYKIIPKGGLDTEYFSGSFCSKILACMGYTKIMFIRYIKTKQIVVRVWFKY